MNNERAELIEKPTLEVAAKKALTALEDLLEHGSSAPWKSWEKALNATVPLRQALLAADAQGGEPVARVEVMNTGGNAGLATRIVEIYNPHRDALRPGALLYTHHQPQAVAQGCAGALCGGYGDPCDYCLNNQARRSKCGASLKLFQNIPAEFLGDRLSQYRPTSSVS